MAEKRVIKITKRQLEELNFAEDQLMVPKLSKRIQCIKLKNEWWTHEKVSKFLWIVIETARVWIKNYLEWWIPALLSWEYKGKISLLSLWQLEEIKKKNKENPFDTAKHCKQYIKETYWIDYHLHRVQKLLKKNFTSRSRNKK